MSEQEPPMFRWFDNVLAGSGLPMTDAQFQFLKLQGITAAVSLTSEEEESVVGDIHKKFEGFGIKHQRITVRDKCPPTRDELVRFTRLVEVHGASGGRMLVHCMWGVGRVGTAGAAYLCHKGVPVIQALEQVGHLETEEQRDAVIDFSLAGSKYKNKSLADEIRAKTSGIVKEKLGVHDLERIRNIKRL